MSEQPIVAAINAKSGATTKNLGISLELPNQPREFSYDTKLRPILLCALKEGVGTTTDLVLVLTAIKSADGTQRLAVVTGAPLVAAAPTAVAVGVASGVLVAANPDRRYLCLVNTSANIVSLGFGAPAVLNSGVTLIGAGSSYEMTEANLYRGAINAIASGAASNVGVQEST